MLTETEKNRNSTSAAALTTSGTRPEPAAVTLAEMLTPAKVMPKARSFAPPENSTVKKNSFSPGVPEASRSPKATRKWKLATSPKLEVPRVSPPSREMSK